MDYAAAKSTICRQCGRHFAPAAPRPGLQLRVKEEAEVAAVEPSAFRKIEGIWGRQRSRVVACFECKRKHEVSDAATSTNCPGCSAHIDLRDYKINTPFSRSIRTRGEIHLTAKGDLSSTSVVCRSAVIEGRLRGNLQCEETATIDFVGKIPGCLSAKHVIVERKAEVQCYRRVTVGSIDIKGRMSGEIVATGAVNIHKTGVLEGDVTAKSLAIEKGGIFSGGLVIGQKGDLKQAELLPETKPVEESGEEPSLPAASAQPLPAT
ncbi:MAG TPA: polymer-forming cytoskeletal protein [Chthoniobacterales bacterium]|jgi:cytoskeletal protein CcmA (bactofilin family)/DNA-directed RNA polymerase subunit RPC12/RpoP